MGDAAAEEKAALDDAKLRCWKESVAKELKVQIVAAPFRASYAPNAARISAMNPPEFAGHLRLALSVSAQRNEPTALSAATRMVISCSGRSAAVKTTSVTVRSFDSPPISFDSARMSGA